MDVILSNGEKLPMIGAGTFPYKDTLSDAFPNMIDAGFTLFDTSDNYNNEQFVGDAIAHLSDDAKESLLVVSKYSYPELSVKQAFDRSTNNLRRKPDIYLMHWPYPYLWERRWKEMETLYKEGHCKAIGVCNFNVDKLNQLMSICSVKPMIDQFECHPMFQQNEIQQFCKKEDIQIMSYSPLARMNKELFSNEILNEIASKRGVSVGQIILAWNIGEGRIPIPASDKKDHIFENYRSIEVNLTEEEMKKIDTLEKGMRIRFDPDTRFTRRQKLKFAIIEYKLRLFSK